MEMGSAGSMATDWVPLRETVDPHTLSAKLHFSMAGPWTIRVRYAKGREIDRPLDVRSQ